MDNLDKIAEDKIIPKALFHYTSFKKFKCILQSGTMRFKLSTQSNDLLDTRYVVDLIRKMEYFNHGLDEIKEKLLTFFLGYYRHHKYKNCYRAFVACFTDLPDSRLLWDAYTMNRPKSHEGELTYYNGVCLAFRRDKIFELLRKAESEAICSNAMIAPIFYEQEQQILALDYLSKRAMDIFDTVKDDEDQSQTFVPTIKQSINRTLVDIKANLILLILH